MNFRMDFAWNLWAGGCMNFRMDFVRILQEFCLDFFPSVSCGRESSKKILTWHAVFFPQEFWHPLAVFFAAPTRPPPHPGLQGNSCRKFGPVVYLPRETPERQPILAKQSAQVCNALGQGRGGGRATLHAQQLCWLHIRVVVCLPKLFAISYWVGQF